jgi:hypothetical protein
MAVTSARRQELRDKEASQHNEGLLRSKRVGSGAQMLALDEVE